MVRIAVTGARGRLGGQVARLLAARPDCQVVTLSRREPPAGPHPGNVSEVRVDYDDPASAQGRADVAALAAELGVTPETVRKDLTSLERQGLLRRVHGGAIPVERLGFEPAVGPRAERYQEEKDQIAKAAIAELPVQEAILLDSGTTTARIAELGEIDTLITDTGADDGLVAELKSAGLRVVQA